MPTACWSASAARTRAIADFVAGMQREPPPLGRIDRIEIARLLGRAAGEFRIAESEGGAAHTQVTPDAAICPTCAREVLDPFERRYRYPFTNCTHCGPRFSIVTGIPYDRAQTTHGAVPDVRQAVPRRISRACRPPLPRRGHRLSCLRAEGEARSASTAAR